MQHKSFEYSGESTPKELTQKQREHREYEEHLKSKVRNCLRTNDGKALLEYLEYKHVHTKVWRRGISLEECAYNQRGIDIVADLNAIKEG